jgi:transposase
MIIPSVEPSPLSGERPNHVSMKSKAPSSSYRPPAIAAKKLYHKSAKSSSEFKAKFGLAESRGIPKRGRVRFNMLAGKEGPAWMARAYSLDLRERVVAAVAAGQSCRSAAKTFMVSMVSVASVVKWSQRHRVIRSPATLKMGVCPYVVTREKDWLPTRIAEKADLTLRALLEELANRGLLVSY